MDHLVLVVDDHLPNLRLAEAALETAGYRVLKVETAEAAMSVLNGILPDAILVDIAMPGMNGLDFTRWLKRNKKLAHIPVVAVTAYSMPADEANARAAGCVGYLTKPYEIRELLRLVRQTVPA